MRLLTLLLVVVMCGSPVLARAEPCRLALVLALDVSGSVNEAEYAQQLDGVATALDSAPVRALILGNANVELAVFEWSSQNHQFLVQPWITLDSHAAIDAAVSNIRSYQKRRAGLKTALSTAMLFASELLEQRNHCWQKKIDVSGDGKNNIGPRLDQVYSLARFADLTVNALVVGDPSSGRAGKPTIGLTKSDLQVYFQREVIRGPDAFTIIAQGYGDYARAMKMKLVRELQVPVIGSVWETCNRRASSARVCVPTDGPRTNAKITTSDPTAILAPLLRE